ncbi:hypothetical protein KIN20_015515 [Parelaphostrongylus tenuis]|uniref:PAP-associated domain-containing protein n=1 Tax=Parelaphostrongylus tenuis TaxID=148309 RepID=A0AAD5N0R6_PARTN|nr:hypothetical protein KIN20_015515 [Parelaphostrongylus tenuis]
MSSNIGQVDSIRNRVIPLPVPLQVVTTGLPVIGLQNGQNVSTLRHIQLTPHISKNNAGMIEISRAMRLYREDNSFTPYQFHLIHRFKIELEIHLSNYFGVYASLMIFGSTLNGFATRSCDVDMSLSFPFGPPLNGKVVVGGVVSPDLVMREVANALVNYPNTCDEQFICAKVPIVRFRGKKVDIMADISYGNDLALYNTKLLHQYCMWDMDRLPTLGIWVKTWAKRCGVCDASKGSLSSYAWILMLIHYLQRTKPIRLLPFLQFGIFRSNFVDGWNVDFWKFVDVHRSQFIAVSTFELFVGFLDYFSNYFQYHKYIIQINIPGEVARNRSSLRRPMVLRDPFDLDRNLAQGVSRPMFRFIHLCMKRSYEVFKNQSLRAEFLVSKGFRKGTTDNVQMSDDLLREYAAYLLHVCVPVQQPPIRKFDGRRDRTTSSSTNTSS